jgi:2-octaprenyl-6-methoxyphenol hydroxylase
MNQSVFDVLIVGSGLVGASLACALDGSGLRVGLVEASAGTVAAPVPSFDERNLALARASRNALVALGVWSRIAAAPSPIRRIHVSSRGDFGAVRLDAADYGLDAFGAVVVARELGAALESRLDSVRALERFRPARVEAVREAGELLEVETLRGSERVLLQTRLLVGADGTESAVRAARGIAVARHDYDQTLFVSTLLPARTHAQQAFERFTDSGPVALLPLAGARMGCVCTVARADAERVAALDDRGWIDLVQERFGWRLGRLSQPGRRHGYAMQRVVAESLLASRTVLVGNAAQTVHPIGAQGFNLGLRDALTLAEELIAAHAAGADPGEAQRLQRYAARRRIDREQTLAFSDGLVRLFANRFAPLRAARGLGLIAVDRLAGVRDALVAGAMGFRGDVPRLARDPDARGDAA